MGAATINTYMLHKLNQDFDQVEEMSVSDSFVVDIERFSHVAERESNANPRISRSHSRKGSTRCGGEKKIDPTAANGTTAAVEASTAATLHDNISTPENPGVVDHVTNPTTHHQITLKKGSLSPAAESKRSRFRHSRLAWSTDPKKVFVFFATLSSMGTVVLIYFTLSMSKLYDDGQE